MVFSPFFTHGLARLDNMHASIACGLGVTASSNWVSLGLDACVLFLQHAPCLGGCAFLQWSHRGHSGMDARFPVPGRRAVRVVFRHAKSFRNVGWRSRGRAVQHGERSRVHAEGITLYCIYTFSLPAPWPDQNGSQKYSRRKKDGHTSRLRAFDVVTSREHCRL